MIVARTRDELREKVEGWRKQGLKTGFVPTMGALHEGHLSLVEIARKHSDRVVASIFVNPAQFAPHEDFAAYPRDEKTDLEKFRAAGVDLVYTPSAEEIYPGGVKSDISPGPAAQGLESDIRPHFFGGVISVVSRLFDHVKPDVAVFGEKDYQQLQAIKEFVKNENLPIEILGGPIIRDAEGLALSSRNAYLSPDELKIARKLNVILRETALFINLPLSSRRKPGSSSVTPSQDPGFRRDDAIVEIIKNAREKLLGAGFDEVQYLEIRWNRLLAAVKLGKTRLIDNVSS